MSTEDRKESPPWEEANGEPEECQSWAAIDRQENKPAAPVSQAEISATGAEPDRGPQEEPTLDCDPPQEDSTPLPRGAFRDFGECKAACNYLDRIGARFSAIDTAIVETAPDQDGYRAPRVTIKFGSGGRVSLTPENAAFAPTEEEQQAIFEEAEYCSLVEPAAIDTAGILDDPRTPAQIKKAYHNGRLYALYDARTGRCTMLQERIEATKTHKKFVLPWTFWSDGRWLKKAASGPFPFWGMDTLRAAPEGVKVFLHEGAKSAWHGANLPTDHPWADELKINAVHIGWISGARTPKNNDWTGLAKVLEDKKVDYVVIVCDNDQDGLDALLPIAKEIHAATFAIRFPEEWAKGFDIADPFPRALWKRSVNGRLYYQGPSFLDCLSACTWPLDYWYDSPPPAKGKNKNPFKIEEADDRDGTEAGEAGRQKKAKRGQHPRPAFIRQWVYVDSTKQFINRHIPVIALLADAFDNAMSPFSQECGPLSELLLPKLELHCGGVAYRPGQPVIIGNEGMRLFNCYRPSNAKPVIGGDITPFLEFMEYLIPIKWDRDESLRWTATLIGRPGNRMFYGILGISEKQGVGKDTWARIIKTLVGFRNCSNPTATHIITSQFHEWRVNKLLCVVSEIYEGENWTAYNRLKSIFTEDRKEVNKKFVGSHDQDNWLHLMLFSNSLRCLKIEKDDRRLLIPRITETPWPRKKFIEFNDWLYLQGGFGIILDWALNFETKHGGQYAQYGDEAPMTESKADLIDACRSPAEDKTIEMIEELVASDQARVVPAHVIWGVLSEYLEKAEKTQQAHIREAVMKLFRGTKKLHVTSKDDRARLGGTDKEPAILNPAAILEIELLFGAKILHGYWIVGSGQRIRAADVTRPEAPRSIVDYLRERRIEKWGIIQGDSGVEQHQTVNLAAKTRHPIGSWPHYTNEFVEEWLKTGRGKN
jgi:Family of unknown function (DUF5906)